MEPAVSTAEMVRVGFDQMGNAGVATSTPLILTTEGAAGGGTVDAIMGVIYYRKNVE